MHFNKIISQIMEQLTGRMASCLLCMAPCNIRQGICHSCLADLPPLGVACNKCCEPIVLLENTVDDTTLLCPRCQEGKRQFRTCITALQYRPPVSTMLQKLKYAGYLPYLKPLSQHLLHELERYYSDTPWPEALLPVPMHWWKIRRRGFNQAHFIARQLGRETGVPLLDNHVKKQRSTESQSRLGAKKRQRNVVQSYRIKKHISQQHIAIIDDVMTTGATVDELCRALKRHGVQTIDVWCIARTPPVRY